MIGKEVERERPGWERRRVILNLLGTLDTEDLRLKLRDIVGKGEIAEVEGKLFILRDRVRSRRMMTWRA